MPWYAFSFLTLWFELLGFSHKTAAALRMAFDIGCTCGNLIGGAILAAHALSSGLAWAVFLVDEQCVTVTADEPID